VFASFDEPAAGGLDLPNRFVQIATIPQPEPEVV
jgi:hypothetical protein